jgi:hypothetical protein
MPNDPIKFNPGSQSPTGPSVEEISAHGDVSVRLAIIRVVTIVTAVLATGGIAAWFWKPENAKELWVIIGPIISGAVSGSIGFIAGERASGRTSNRKKG